MAALAATEISSRLRNWSTAIVFGGIRDAEHDRLGPGLEVEQALDRRHFIRLVPKDPFGLRHRVLNPAAPAADLHVLSNGARAPRRG